MKTIGQPGKQKTEEKNVQVPTRKFLGFYNLKFSYILRLGRQFRGWNNFSARESVVLQLPFKICPRIQLIEQLCLYPCNL